MKVINFEQLLQSWESCIVMYKSTYTTKKLKYQLSRWKISTMNGMWEAYRSVGIIVQQEVNSYYINKDQVSLENIKKAAKMVADRRKQLRTKNETSEAPTKVTISTIKISTNAKVKKEPNYKLGKKVDIHRNDGVLVDLTLQECKAKLEANGFVVLPKPNKGETYEAVSDKKTMSRINTKVKLQKKLNDYQKLTGQIINLINKL